MNLRFLILLGLSTAVHAYVLWEAEADRPPALPLARGRVSVELVATAAVAPRPRQEAPAQQEISQVPAEETIVRRVADRAPSPHRQALPLDASHPAPSVPWQKLRPPVEPLQLPRPMVEPLKTVSSMPRPASLPSVRQIEGIRTEAYLLGTENLVYPPEAQRRGLEGRVVLWLRISAAGQVLEAKVQQSSGYQILDEHTLRYVNSLRFAPARQGKTPIPTTVLLPVRYRLVDEF